MSGKQTLKCTRGAQCLQKSFLNKSFFFFFLFLPIALAEIWVHLEADLEIRV